MKLLHTSDWHLGRALHDKKRYDEFDQFLDELLGLMQREQVDVLLVAGDVFDTTTPPNRAQEQYFDFLSRLPSTGCRHAVIIGGNHDSPSFLEAPRDLLRRLNIHVVGEKQEQVEDEVIALHGPDGALELLVCAVPFLRDRDVRMVAEGETMSDKSRKLADGILTHYQEVLAAARALQPDPPVPLVGMGHLFTREGQSVEGDGVRELYVGSLAHVDGDLFASGFDYTALGHLHLPQQVAGNGRVRYSGSPIPMGFGEAGSSKMVVLVEFEGRVPHITEYAIPCFREMKKLKGPLAEVLNRLENLKNGDPSMWIEVELTDGPSPAEATNALNAVLDGSRLEVLRVKNPLPENGMLEAKSVTDRLETLDHSEVFQRKLETTQKDDTERSELLLTYQEAYDKWISQDPNGA